jgi:hypothetical protein
VVQRYENWRKERKAATAAKAVPQA